MTKESLQFVSLTRDVGRSRRLWRWRRTVLPRIALYTRSYALVFALDESWSLLDMYDD